MEIAMKKTRFNRNLMKPLKLIKIAGADQDTD